MNQFLETAKYAELFYDTPDEHRKSVLAYKYCKYIKNDIKVALMITRESYCSFYCKNILNLHALRDRLTESLHCFYYCRHINNHKTTRDKIIEPEYCYLYCTQIKDDPEVRKRMNPYWLKQYHSLITNWGKLK
jgi:hypothetical protein